MAALFDYKLYEFRFYNRGKVVQACPSLSQPLDVIMSSFHNHCWCFSCKNSGCFVKMRSSCCTIAIWSNILEKFIFFKQLGFIGEFPCTCLCIVMSQVRMTKQTWFRVVRNHQSVYTHTINPLVHMTKRDVGFSSSQLQNPGSFGAALLSAPV